MPSFRDGTVLAMELDYTNHFESKYRLLIGGHIKYLLVAPHTFDREILGFPPQMLTELPPLPQDPEWNIGRISRNPETGALAASFIKQQLKCISEIWHPKAVEYVSLTLEKRLAPNVRLVSYKNSSRPDKVLAIAKFACFEFEIPRVEQETRAYKLLAGIDAAPSFLGHITEDSRPIGLLLEKLEGRAAGPQDLEACSTSLRKVHALGILHGDVNRYNFIVGKIGVKIVDFENSKFSNDSAAMQKELDSLSSQLKEETGRGGPSLLVPANMSIPADMSIEALTRLFAVEKEKI